MLEIQRLKNLIVSSNAGTWEANVLTGETLINERWAEIIGYTLDELRPIDNSIWLRHCHPADIERAKEAIQRHFAMDTEFYEIELRARHKNGSYVWVHDKGKVVEWNSHGRPLYLFGFRFDITEKKRVEEALIESEKRYNMALEAAQTGLFEWDLQNDSIYYSTQFKRILGYDDHEIGNSYEFWKNTWHPEDAPRIERAHHDRRQRKTDYRELEYRFRHRNGEWRWLLSRGRFLLNSEGVPYRYIGTILDITQQKNEQAKRETLKSNLFMREKHLELLKLDGFEVDGFLDRTLELAVAFTQSQIGFIFFYDEDQKILTLHSWSPAVLEECQIPGRTWVFQLEKLGLLGEVIRQGKPIIINDYLASHLKKNGYPEGHIPIHNYISIPVYKNGKIVAVLSAANKTSDYTEEDILNLNLLMSTAWTAVERINAELLLREEKELFITTLLSIGEGVLVTDAAGNITLINPLGEQILGLPRNEVLGKKYYEVFKAINIRTKETLLDPIKLALETGKILQTPENTGLVHRDGSEIYILGSVAPIFTRGGEINGAVLTARDITANMLTEESLKFSEHKYRLIAESTSDVIWILNLNTSRFTYISPAVLALTGFTVEESLAQTLEEMIEEEYLHHIYEIMPLKVQELAENPNSIVSHVFDLKLKCKNGGSLWAEASVKLRCAENQEIEVVGVTRNIEERKKFETELVQLSFYDQLTGLYNRRFYVEEIKRLDVERNLPLTLVMADVNGLKFTNDIFGHAAGDESLKVFAEILKKNCRSDDIMARIGGDEFALLLPKTNSQQAENIIQRIQNAIADNLLENSVLSVSFGWKTKTKSEEITSELASQADDMMYHRKLLHRESFEQDLICHLANTLYEQDESEKLHSEKSAEICKKIAVALDMSPESVIELETAGLLHDIGKIGIDRDILKKPGTLSPKELEDVQRHSEIGYQILQGLKKFKALAFDVLCHHERPDGKGYPKGLYADQIPLYAKVISVADAYCAMSTNSLYRDILSEDEIIQEFKNNSGTQFDEQIARIFVEKVMGKAWA